MSQTIPGQAKFVVIGAGIHGLSTAWHLAMELEARGTGSGKDIVLLDKTGPGAGATGVACGCVRNFYMTEPLHAILRHSVDVWEYDPVNLGFQQVGYISCGEANQQTDYENIHRSQNNAGYPSDLYVGQDAKKFLKSIWPDFKTDNVDVVIHELPSGYAGTHMVTAGMDRYCDQYGVQRHYGAKVTDLEVTNGQVSSVKTDSGDI
ncbi:MAG: FAD-binding oxidoreductase, partial [Gammaproteobacteria bacterium]|nr:FAD-binding oxidoreductase [Gammaproteobacteria bacterium]